MALLPIKPAPAFLGAVIGAAVFVLLNLLLHSLLPVLLSYLAVVLIGYIVCSATVGDAAGEFFRGVMIGVNSAVNWVLASALFGPVFGIIVSSLAFLSSVGALSKSGLYQGLLGYLNWLLPASWPIVGLGFSFFLLCVLGALSFGLAGAAYFKIQRIAFEWKTGTLFTQGGWISNLNPLDTAFNMGNFAFVDRVSTIMHMDHEAGHTLNLAAFGSVFHLLGALDENVLRGIDALSERLAESHVPSSSRPQLGMWV
jgi:hypothetical protein